MLRLPNPLVTIVAALVGLNWLHARAVRWAIRRNLTRLWAGDPDMDGDLEALVLGASIKFTTGFTADKR